MIAMEERHLTPLDRLFGVINNALTTVVAPASRVTRENPAAAVPESPLSDRERSHSAGLMRVNHAGEVAAQGLYQGHAMVSRDPAVTEQLQQAADDELDHLGWCEQRLHELQSRPSVLSPVWYAGAVAVGAASGVLGDRWSLGFVEETERQVAEHLSGHMQKLPATDRKSHAIVSRMRDEEQLHGAAAQAAGAAELPEPVKRLMRLTAGIMTRAAYWM